MPLFGDVLELSRVCACSGSEIDPLGGRKSPTQKHYDIQTKCSIYNVRRGCRMDGEVVVFCGWVFHKIERDQNRVSIIMGWGLGYGDSTKGTENN